MILTPYFSTIIQQKYNECVEEPDYNYTAYNIFCLKTRLYPIIHKLFDKQVDILIDTYVDPSLSYNYDDHTRLEFSNIAPSKIFIIIKLVRYQSVKETNKNELNLSDSTIEIELTPHQHEYIQSQVNLITSKDVDACLLISTNIELLDEFGYKISNEWLTSMLPYIQINQLLHPFVNEYGLHVVLTRYVTGKKPMTYLERYYLLLQSGVRQLQKMYMSGYIIIPPTVRKEQIIDNWDLEPVDNDGLLYRPRWFDLRFTRGLGGMVPFLQSRLRGDKYVDIEVSENLVRRHFIAKQLRERDVQFEFINSFVRCNITNITDARILSSIIINAQSQAHGFVDIRIYPSEQLRENGEEGKDCVEYQSNDPLRPYTISCLS